MREPQVREAFLDCLTASGQFHALKTEAPLWTSPDRAAKPDEALTCHCFVKNLKQYAREAGVEGVHLQVLTFTHLREHHVGGDGPYHHHAERAGSSEPLGVSAGTTGGEVDRVDIKYCAFYSMFYPGKKSLDKLFAVPYAAPAPLDCLGVIFSHAVLLNSFLTRCRSREFLYRGVVSRVAEIFKT
jgi:hypothetical protein